MFGLTRDITERKKAEKEKKILDKKIRQTQKMEAIGTLAGGIAHDFNNILSPIMGYTDLCMGSAPGDDSIPKYIRQIKKNTK